MEPVFGNFRVFQYEIIYGKIGRSKKSAAAYADKQNVSGGFGDECSGYQMGKAF